MVLFLSSCTRKKSLHYFILIKQMLLIWKIAENNVFSPGDGVLIWVSQVVLVVKNPTANAEDTGDVSSIPWVGKIPWRSVGGQSEVLRPWQRSWGRRLDIRKGGIEPQESPWKSSSIYPHNLSLPTLLLCALTYTSDFTGGCPPRPLWEKELT